MGALARAALVFSGLALVLQTSIPAAIAQSAVETGEQLFETNCAPCHGERISNPNNLFDLKELTKDDRARFDRSVRQGKGQMPAWEGTFSDEEFDAIWAYIRSVAD
ncbi:MAG: cytochrome c [Beijerinckiaceae bacterium]|nr:cytochrome c [Beijerinckiaceae bacterium]